MATPDTELGAVRSNYPIGYSSFAHFIASDTELSVYRRFNHVSARNILYLQSELAELESQLLKFDAEDYRLEKLGNKDNILSTRCWNTFALKAENPGREKEKMDLIRRIRPLVKEYRASAQLRIPFDAANQIHLEEALVLQSQVLNLEMPNSRVWVAFTTWFNGHSTKPLIETTLSITHDRQDLVALRPAVDKDRLSRFLQTYGGYASYILWVCRKSRVVLQTLADEAKIAKGNALVERPVHTFSEDSISQLAKIISVSTAAILLIVPIISLYSVHSEKARLGMIAGFTVFFALSIALFTNARRAETFASTAAYAAVLVVFVSGNLGGGKNF